MGLDMYLERRKKIVDESEWEEVAYWRKANQIRDWFDRKVGVENCKHTIISKKRINELIDDCKKVLNKPELAKDILPTSSGFFFGSTEYDEWYFNQLENTVLMLERILQETDFKTEEITYFEWW